MNKSECVQETCKEFMFMVGYEAVGRQAGVVTGSRRRPPALHEARGSEALRHRQGRDLESFPCDTQLAQFNFTILVVLNITFRNIRKYKNYHVVINFNT